MQNRQANKMSYKSADNPAYNHEIQITLGKHCDFVEFCLPDDSAWATFLRSKNNNNATECEQKNGCQRTTKIFSQPNIKKIFEVDLWRTNFAPPCNFQS